MNRAELAEQIARRIAAAGGTDPKQPEDGTWRLWLDVADSIADLVADAWDAGAEAYGMPARLGDDQANPYRRADA